MTPEGRIKARTDRLLDNAKAYRLKPVQNGMGAPALDYHCIHRGLPLCIETKAPGKWPTPRQLITMKKIVEAGGTVFVVRDDDDLRELETWLANPLGRYFSRSATRCLSQSCSQP